jgi:hypothetical protein
MSFCSLNCTGWDSVHLTTGHPCPYCLQTIVADAPKSPATATGTGTGSVAALEAHTAVPVASCAPGVASDRKAGGGPVPVATAPGVPNRHARNTDPNTAHEAALSVSDPHKRRLYDHILGLIFEHGPLTDWQLAQKLTQRLGEPIIATSSGKRRGEMRDMGLLYDTGFRGPTETGPKKAIRWGLTPAGVMEVSA